MNIIEKTAEIISKFEKFAQLRVHCDFTDGTDSSGLASVDDKLIFESVTGCQNRQHTFLLYSVFSGMNDYERFANSSLLLELSLYLETCTGDRVTSLINGIQAEGYITKIKAENGMLLEAPENNGAEGILYQLTITAEYTAEKRGL